MPTRPHGEQAYNSSAVPLHAGRHLFIPTGHYLPWLLASLPAYCAIRASGVAPPIVPVPSLRTARAPMSGSSGRVAGVAYVTLKLHVSPVASEEQGFADTVYKPPMLTRRFSAVISKGAVPVLVTVITLVTEARGVGIVNVKVGTPTTLPSVPLVAERMLNVPCPPPPPPPVVAPNSTAPASTALLVFLALPKKSKAGAGA